MEGSGMMRDMGERRWKIHPKGVLILLLLVALFVLEVFIWVPNQ